MRYVPASRFSRLAGLFLLAVVLVVTTFLLPARKPGSQKITLAMKVDNPKVIADRGHVTKANFERIKKGMTFDEVRAVLCGARFAGTVGNVGWVMWWWYNFPDDGAEISVQFAWPRDKQGGILSGQPKIVSDAQFHEGKENVKTGK